MPTKAATAPKAPVSAAAAKATANNSSSRAHARPLQKAARTEIKTNSTARRSSIFVIGPNLLLPPASPASSSTRPPSGPSDKTINRIVSTMLGGRSHRHASACLAATRRLSGCHGLGIKSTPRRQLALRRMSGRESHRKKGPAHSDLARQVDPSHSAGKPDIRKDHGDVSPTD